MSRRKKTYTLIMSIMLIFGCVMPVFADASSSNLNMTVSSTSVQAGDTVTVTVTVNGNPELNNFAGGVSFDTSLFTCTNIQGSGTTTFYIETYNEDFGSWDPKGSSSQSQVSEANGNGKVGFVFMLNNDRNIKFRMRGSVLFTATFEAKKCGSAAFTLYENSSTVNPDHGPYAYISSSAKTVGVLVRHDLSMTAGTTAGCEHGGMIDYWTCSICGRLFSDAAGTQEISQSDIYIDALGHNWGDGTVTKEPTCTETGRKTYTCTQCYVETREEEIPALGHAWGEGKVTREATCDKTGIMTYTCTRCGAARTEDIPSPEHSWDAGKVTKEPTCDVAGTRTYTCTKCGGTKTEDIAAIGHDYKIDYSWNRELTRVTATATCKRNSSHKVTETANVEKREALAACGQPTTVTYTAKFKNSIFSTQTRTENVASAPHQLQRNDAVAPGCKTPGSIEYYTCTICGKTFRDAEGKETIAVADTVLEPAGHDLSEAPVWEWAEDNSKATATFTCVRCKESIKLEAAISRSYNLVVASVKPEGSDKAFTSSQHVDSETNKVTYFEAVNSAGNKLNVVMGPVVSDQILTPETVFSLIDTKKVKEARLDQFTVLWQRELKVPEGSGKVTITLTTEGIGENEELLVFHRDAKKGWQMVGYERAAQQISVTLDSLSPVALVKRSGAPAKEAAQPARNDASAGNSLISGLLSNKKVLIGAGAVLVVLIVVLVLAGTRKKGGRKLGKHSK